MGICVCNVDMCVDMCLFVGICCGDMKFEGLRVLNYAFISELGIY